MINGVELNNSLWPFAIHSQNSEIIYQLIDHHIDPIIVECIDESVKCNHNNITNYIQINLMKNEEVNSKDMFIQSLKNYNFSYIQEKMINATYIYDICYYIY